MSTLLGLGDKSGGICFAPVVITLKRHLGIIMLLYSGIFAQVMAMMLRRNNATLMRGVV